MKFKELSIQGVYLISLEKYEDNRGFFARSYCEQEFKAYGLHTYFPQQNLSYNLKKGTLRGMHYQKAPHEEVKVVSCLKGSVFDVVLDIRENSPTYGKWVGEVLSGENYNMLYIPKGLAHGFQTLEDDTLVHYQMGNFYAPEAAAGIRYDNARFNIKWPIEEKIISEKDLNV